MKIVPRVLPVLINLAMLWNGVRFVIDPASVAAELQMELLTGVSASTQLGDIGGFFIAASIMLALGHRSGASHWFYPAAILFGCAALMRSLVALAGHAELLAPIIVAEVVMALILVAAARSRAGEGESEEATGA